MWNGSCRFSLEEGVSIWTYSGFCVIMIIRSSVFSSAIGVLLARQHSAPGLFSSFGVLRVIKGFEEDLETYPRAVGFYYRLGVLHDNRLLRHHP